MILREFCLNYIKVQVLTGSIVVDCFSVRSAIGEGIDSH